MQTGEFKEVEAFECQRCMECCRQSGYVYLKEEDIVKISAFFEISTFDFVNQFCDLIDRSRVVLKKKNEEDCIFLAAHRCVIHGVRPGQCRDFPLTWNTQRSMNYCEGLREQRESC